MDPLSPSGRPGEPLPGESNAVNGEARGAKRKRAGAPTALASRDDPLLTYMRKRMAVLSRLQQRRAPVESVKSFWKIVLDALREIDSQDVPFALLCSVKEQNPQTTELKTPGRDCASPERLRLEGTLGLDQSSAEAAQFFSLATAVLCQEPQSPEQRILPIDQSSHLGRVLQKASFDSKQFADKAMICPIFAHETNVTGFIILGMNSWTDDEDFRVFVQVLTDSVSKFVSSTILLMSLRDVQGASKELLRRVEEAERSNAMFRHMAESAAVGCAIFNPGGHPMWLNDAYCNLTGVAREDFEPGVWQKAIVPDDLPRVEGRWKELASGKPIVPFTFRVKRRYDAKAKPGSCESLDYRWLLSNAYVDLNEDGSSRRVMGWLTDISADKWNERLQAQRLEDALETKRQTEKFIDMVSHEMRNPLSAIIQTADGVLTSIDQRYKDAKIDSKDFLEIRDNIADAGKTINLCANHQKRIVDDILTLSKLDSNLLIISPTQVRPLDLVNNAVKMFEAELSSALIDSSISIDASYEKLSIDTVLLDESRTMQILLNLITNAIKFTRDRTERYVRIRLAASSSRPSIGQADISYIAPRSPHINVPTSADLWNEENIYLLFAVEDTGQGLSKDEMKSLFQRFSQASPKTYSSYGGFGLGLFICRELAELQGGQIGLSSVPGQGTTFTFYVEARRQTPLPPKRASISHVKLLDIPNQSLLHDMNGNQSHASPEVSSVNDDEPSTKNLDPQTLHILVVEDNKINQTVLVRQLRVLGCKVYTADDGCEALDHLSRTTFFTVSGLLDPPLDRLDHEKDIQKKDIKSTESPTPLSVVLMDLEMPIMDGLTCVRRIREMEDDGFFVRHVPVIAVTANARNEQIAEAMKAGMDDVVIKPFRIPDLLPKIAAVIHEIDGGM